MVRVNFTLTLMCWVTITPSFISAKGGNSRSSSHGFSGGKSVSVRSYTTKKGTFVQFHYRSYPDGNSFNNWSVKGNINPYTGQSGTHSPQQNQFHSYSSGNKTTSIAYGTYYTSNLYPSGTSPTDNPNKKLVSNNKIALVNVPNLPQSASEPNNQMIKSGTKDNLKAKTSQTNSGNGQKTDIDSVSIPSPNISEALGLNYLASITAVLGFSLLLVVIGSYFEHGQRR